MDKVREGEKRLLSTHRHFRYRCMRARAREKRARGAKGEREEGGREGGREKVRRGWKGRDELARARRREKGTLFRETILR